MNAALAWLNDLIGWFAQFVPRWEIIDTTKKGVRFESYFEWDRQAWKFRPKMRVAALDPGLHFFWPARSQIVTYPAARQTTDLRAQTLVTADDKTICVGGLITYEIEDIKPLLADSYEPEQVVEDLTLGALGTVVTRLEWVELKQLNVEGKLDKQLKRETQRELREYGVRVHAVTLTDLSPCRVYKLMGDGDASA